MSEVTKAATQSVSGQAAPKGQHNQKEYPLHGWDDEKIYYWDEDRGRERCVSDDEVLYKRLVEMCRKHFTPSPD